MMTEDTRHIYESLIPGLKWTDKKETSANCPLHDDIHPSMSINNETGKWYCHVCNTGGSAETLNKKIKGIEPGMNTISGKKNIDTIYEYTDESGRRLYQVVRYKEPKTFLQRRPDGNGGWIWNTDGVRSVPYNLPDVVKADLIFDVEGEKDNDVTDKKDSKSSIHAGCNRVGSL